MRTQVFALAAIVLFLAALSIACASVSVTPLSPTVHLLTSTRVLSFTPPQPTFTPSVTRHTPSAAPSCTLTLTPGRRYPSAFGIDYGNPEKYLAQGEQTRLTNPAVIDALRGEPPGIAQLGEIYFWIRREFKTWSAGGKTIGAITTDQLFAERRLGGCHDWGLVYASIARELGYPAVMVDTASIAWAKQFQAGQKGPCVGHVFVEVFVDSKWVLVDSTNNWYVESGYDPANTVIPLRGSIAGANEEAYGFFVMRKGVDTWGYGIRSNQELMRLMEDSAQQLKIEALVYPSYNFQRFK
jgi:hypothetical protein